MATREGHIVLDYKLFFVSFALYIDTSYPLCVKKHINVSSSKDSKKLGDNIIMYLYDNKSIMLSEYNI